MTEIEDCVKEAIQTMQNFVKEVTGEYPTQEEIAKALKKYFVLKEIADYISLERENRDNSQETVKG